MSSPAALAGKCARARELLEEAQRLVEEVLEDPAYRPDDAAVLPRGVCPDAAEDYLDSVIGALTPFTAEELAQIDRDEQRRGLRLIQ